MPSYTWQEGKDKSLRRAVYGCELQLCHTTSSIKCFATPLAALTIKGRFSAQDFQHKLKDAWIALRFQAPGIANRILVSDDNFEFEHTSPSNLNDVDEWVAVTLLEKPSIATSQELVSALINDRQELNKARVDGGDYVSHLYFAQGLEEGQYHLCLFSQHVAVDGRGSLLASNILLQYVVEPQEVKAWGQEIERLPLPISYTLGMRKDGDTAPDGLQDIVQAMQKAQADNQPFCTLPSQKSNVILQDVVTLYARLDLPSTITDGIKKVAKAHETQFSYVVGIAISLAIFKNSTNREIAKAVILPGAPSDTRFRLPEDKRRTHIANGLVAAGSMIVPTSALKEVEEVATRSGQLSPMYWQAVDILTKQWENGRSSELALKLEQELSNAFSGMIKNTPEVIFSPSCFYPPLGVADSFVKHSYGSGPNLLQVDEPVITSNAAVTPCLCVHTWSWKGEFTAFVNYSTDFYSTEFANKFLNDIKFYLELVVADI